MFPQLKRFAALLLGILCLAASAVGLFSRTNLSTSYNTPGGWEIVGYIIIGIAGVLLVFVYLGSFRKDSGNLDERIGNLQRNKSSTNMNRYAARKETKASVARTQLNATLTNEAAATYGLDAAPDRLGRLEQTEVVAHKNLLTVSEEATRQKISPTTYEQVKLQEGLAQVELLKAQGLKNIDWEYLEKEHDLKLKGAMLLAIKKQKELEGLTSLYEALVRKTHQIETGDDPPEVRKLLVSRLNKNLQIVSEAMDGDRLREEVDGEES